MSQRYKEGYMPFDRTGNRLLVKSELGRNKPTNYAIPEDNFIYGRTTYEDPQHANDMMYKWKYHQQTDNKNNNKFKDMLQTNKQCLKSLLHTSSQFGQFRKSKTLYKGAKQGSTVIKIKLPEQNHTYGLPLQLQDPLKLVIANSYGEDDQYARHTFYQQQTQSKQIPQRKLSCYITKNHNLLKQATAKRLQKFDWNKKNQLWKISKFTQVGFKVETRRPRLTSHK